MGIMLLGPGGQMTQVKEHKGSVIIKKTCYRGTYNEQEFPEMPPRANYKEACVDMENFCKAKRDAEGGMCVYSLRMGQPRKVLAGTDA